MKQNKRIHPTEIGDMLYPIHKKVHYINCGGCGIFAVALYKELVKHGFKPKILTLEHTLTSYYDCIDYRYSYLRKLQYARRNNSQPGEGAHSHYMVRLGNYALDSKGSFPIEIKSTKDYDGNMCKLETVDAGYHYNVLGTISVIDLEYLIKQDWAWNSTFNRSMDNKRKIAKFIREQLKKILN